MSSATIASQQPAPETADKGRYPNLSGVEPAARPLRICIVYGRTPVPMRRADQMTVAHLLAFLHARGHKVDFFYINAGGEQSEADRDWINANTYHNEAFALSKLSALRGLANTLLRLVPFQVGLFSHPDQRRAVRAAVARNQYDIVYTYYFRSAEITRDLGYGPSAKQEEREGRPASFLAFQLSQTLNTRRIAENAPNLALKLFYKLENRLVERYEARIWRHFSRSVLIGKNDVAEVKAACRKFGQPEIDNFVYGAHGTDVSRFSPRPDIEARPDHLVFSGVMRTPTNVQAAQWFVKEVWPLIREKRPDATFSIVGREPTIEARALGEVPGVTVTGTVPDPAIPIAEAAVCVNPMQAGGGMQNKLIEFMASAKPIVATSVANEGICAPDDCLIVADKPQDFANAVLRLLDDPAGSAAMAARARAHVIEHWTWAAHYLKLEQDFYATLDQPGEAATAA